MQSSIGPPQSVKHRYLEYCYTKSISIGQCYRTQVLPSQSSIEALHTTTATARSRTMHIYIYIYIYSRQMTPHQLCIDALNTVTPKILA